MACTLGYIEDVKQFARLAQLKQAIKDVTPLMEDTTNFIVEFTCDAQGSLWCFYNFISALIGNFMIRTALRSLLSPGKQDKIDELTKRFNWFKQQFDRGISVQLAGTLEMLLEDMGMVLHLYSKANH
jgi:hypothetical protein